MPAWRFHYFSQKDGLSNTFVNCWAQDSIGYVWLGTLNGLNRYDGKGFKIYKAKRNDSTTLPHHQITHLYTHPNGTLWVVTKRGVAYYDRAGDSFIRTRIEDVTPNNNVEVTHFGADKKGNLYLCSGSKLYRYHPDDNMFRIIASIPEGNISKFIFDNDNSLWIGLSNGAKILRFNRQMTGRRVISISSGPTDTYNPVTGMVWCDGKLWTSLQFGGICTVDPSTNRIESHMIDLPDANNTLFLNKDAENNLWSIDYTGLKLYHKKTNTFFATYPNPQNPFSIKDGVSGIFQDNQGNYWAIHSSGGVAIHSQNKGFSILHANTHDFFRLTNNPVTSIQEDTNGNPWFAMDPPSLDIFDYRNGTINHIGSENAHKYNLKIGTFRTLFCDKQGTMWVATYNGGLQYFDKNRKQFVTYLSNPNDPHSIMGNDVKCIDQDDRGNLWLALHGKGVDKFDPNTKQFEHFTHETNKLSNPWTNWLVCDRKERVWVATAWGLSLLEKGSNRFIKFSSSTNDSSTINSNNITTVYEDAEGRIWIGTDQGLCRYIESTNSFEQITIGQSDQTISSILDDNSGYLWVSTLNGLTRINKNTLEYFNLEEADGIQADEFYPNSAYKSPTGILYFGGVNGVTTFNPEKIKFNRFAPPVVISNIIIDDKPFSDFRKSIPNINKNANNAGSLTLTHDDKVVTISYSGLGFNNPQRQQYKILLEGYDKDWRYVGTKTEVTYNQLPPKNYILKIMAANNDGVWDPAFTSLKITVVPPWYGSMVFKVFAFFMTLFLIWVFIWVRTRQLNVQRQQLTILVNAKTEELESSNQELMAQAEYLDSMNKLLADKQDKVESQARILAAQTEALRKSNRDLKQLNNTKDRLFSIVAHDLLNPFTSIMGLTELFKENYDGMDDSERKELSQTIYVSSNRLFNLLQNLLIWARSQTSAIKFDRQSFPLKDVLDEATDHFQDQLEQKSITFSIDCDPSLCAFADVDMVKTIIRNLVNNAIKFTPRNGTIGIIVHGENDFAHISVIDSGVGMDDETAKTLFEPSVFKTSRGTQGETGTGLGLIICKEFVDRNNGEIEVTSALGAGTTFTVKLPAKALF